MKQSQYTYPLNRFKNLQHFEETPFFLTYLPTDLNNIQYTQVQNIMVNTLNLLHSQNMPSINLGFVAECPDRVLNMFLQPLQANSKTVPYKNRWIPHISSIFSILQSWHLAHHSRHERWSKYWGLKHLLGHTAHNFSFI
jgi:hypothetical protein